MAAGTWDVGAIAAALATRFAATTAPGSQTAIAYGTAELPENVGITPCVFVYPFARPEFEYDPGQRSVELIWPVRFIYDFAKDLPRRTLDLYEWWQSLYNLYPISTALDLGLGGYVRNVVSTSAYIEKIVHGDSTRPCVTVEVSTLLGEAIS